MSVVAIIPARYDSVRFPGKVLVRATGKYLIQHTFEQVSLSATLDEVLVATDDQRVKEAVESFGGRAEMTSKTHPSGTDRIAEVAKKLDAEIIVNVQGDEPEIKASSLDALVSALRQDREASLSTIAARFEHRGDVLDPNRVKVVLDRYHRGIYFSRLPIPFGRDLPDNLTEPERYFRHLGVYAYRRDFLVQFAGWDPTPLEQLEKLEQLRALEHGHKIAVALVEYHGIGIDTPSDYEEFVRRQRAG